MSEVTQHTTSAAAPGPAKIKEAESQKTGLASPFLKFLSTIQCKDFIKGKPLFYVKDTDKLEDCVKTLADNQIQSCPVFDSNNKCLGSVDVMDIMEYADAHAPQDDRYDLTRKQHEMERIRAGKEIREIPVKHVIDYAERHPSQAVSQNDTLDKVAKMMAEDTHRVCVYNDKGEAYGIITHSDLVRLCYQHLSEGEYKSIRDTPVQKLGYVIRAIEVVTEDQQLKDAVKLLRKQGISGVPVVDSNNGRLLANFSASDMKGLILDEAPRFTQTIFGFLRRSATRRSSEPKVVTPASTLAQVLKLFALSKLHHLWIVNNYEQPIGVITLANLIHTMCYPREGWQQW